MAKVALKARIGFSLTAVGVTRLLSSIAFGIYARHVGALFAFLTWSVPFFVLGWVVEGVPLIAWSNQFSRKPGFLLVLGITAALAGGMIMLAPGVYVRWMSPESRFIPFRMSELIGWPSLGAAVGTTAMLFYGWLLSRNVSLTKKGS